LSATARSANSISLSLSPSMHGVVLGNGTKKRTSQKKFIRKPTRPAYRG
jgi:hypothetical protein